MDVGGGEGHAAPPNQTRTDLGMVTLAVALKKFRRSGGAVLPDWYGRPDECQPGVDGPKFPGIDSKRQAELSVYLEAMTSTRRPPLVSCDVAPRPSLYQEVWWKLTASQTEGFPYALFPTVIDLGMTDIRMALRAIRATLDRHRVLRSIFLAKSERLEVEFCSADDVEIRVSSVLSESALLELMQVERATAVPITMKPPLRIHLVTHGSRLLAFFTFHHAIIDHMSVRILERELRGCLKRGGVALEESQSRLDFYDWAAWERSWFESTAGSQVCGYWRDWRARVPSLCSPTLKNLEWVRGTRTKHKVHMNTAMVEKIGKRARRLGTTPFLVILCAYVTALRRWSGKLHFPVRAVGNSRVGPLAASGVGLFMCHDPIEVDLQGLASTDDLIEALCAEYRSSVALRIPTHMTGSGADYDALHSSIGASINFVPEAAGRSGVSSSEQPAISLSEPDEEPTDWLVPQPSIVLELIGRRGALSGYLAFNDKIIGGDEQRFAVNLFGEAIWTALDARPI